MGRAQRALDMLCAWAPQRHTFGAALSERQAIQWWVADAATRIHACRLMTHEAAAITERERVQAGVEVEDVDKAYQQLLAAVVEALKRALADHVGVDRHRPQDPPQGQGTQW